MKINVYWQKNSKIALALSGGVDSIVLLHLLITVYKESYQELVIFHINHGLREESAEEERQLKLLADSYGIKFLCTSLNLKKRKRPTNISEEMFARELRYAAFEEMIAKENVQFLLTAHHKNDNIENILMRILSGRGQSSRLDIAESRNFSNITLCRPLLNILKEDLLTYARENKLVYYEDTTNFDVDNYTRNYIRHKIVPPVTDLVSSSLDNVITFASYNNCLKELLNKVTAQNKERIVVAKTENNISLASDYYFSLTPIEREAVLLNIISTEFAITNVKQDAIKAVVANLTEFSGNVRYDIKRNLQIIKEYQSINISKLEKKCYNDKIEITTDDLQVVGSWIFKDQEFYFTKENIAAEVGFNITDLPLLINSRQQGDIFIRGKINKKLARFFIDKKVPASRRDFVPVVRNKYGKILGVLGVGEKVSMKKKYDYYIKMKG